MSSNVKIRLGDLKGVINEALKATEAPTEGDLFVTADRGRVYHDEIYAVGDMSKVMSWKELDDIAADGFGAGASKGPQPGDPGIWLAMGDGMGWIFSPGELVNVPEHDRGPHKAWARRNDVEKINAASEADKPKTGLDKQMLEMLTMVSTNGVGMSNVKNFHIRPRKNSIAWTYDDDDGGRGMQGSIVPSDLTGSLKRGGLQAVAEWMFAHGSKKIKPQKRVPPMMPYYD